MTETEKQPETLIMTGADILLKALKDQGVDVIFGYPGGAVLPIYDALFKQNEIRHILVRHEQGAVHAAEGYARSTGKVGVVLVTSGPGATNAVTGLTDALMDSIPIVCITGQVPTHLIGNDAFQECDTTGITRSCTKHNYLVKSTEKLARTIHEAFYVARTGRPGPVVIDFPKDVQFDSAAYMPPDMIEHRTYHPKTAPDMALIEKAVEMMAASKKPILYTGGGIINAGKKASKLLIEFAHLTGFPVTSTLMGLGAFPASDKQFMGMVGMHGTYESNLAMHGCDVMVALGSRFDDRVTGLIPAFSPQSKKIHVDIDPSSINKNVMVDLPIVGDAAAVLEAMIKVWNDKKLKTNAAALKKWWKQIDFWRARDCLHYSQDKDAPIKPQYALEQLQKAMEKHCAKGGKKDKKRTIVTTEVGQHQMWAAQFLKFEKPNDWLTSGGLGTMGYGLPAAIGAQLGDRDALVVDISGEASVMMNIQELSTAVQYRLPIKIFILNNQSMGMVRQWQELLHEDRYSESYFEVLPDFVALAEAFGLKGLEVTCLEELDGVIDEMLCHEGPVMVNIAVDEKENCFPMIPGGAAHNKMIFSIEEGLEDDDGTSEDGMVLV